MRAACFLLCVLLVSGCASSPRPKPTPDGVESILIVNWGVEEPRTLVRDGAWLSSSGHRIRASQADRVWDALSRACVDRSEDPMAAFGLSPEFFDAHRESLAQEILWRTHPLVQARSRGLARRLQYSDLVADIQARAETEFSHGLHIEFTLQRGARTLRAVSTSALPGTRPWRVIAADETCLTYDATIASMLLDLLPPRGSLLDLLFRGSREGPVLSPREEIMADQDMFLHFAWDEAEYVGREILSGLTGAAEAANTWTVRRVTVGRVNGEDDSIFAKLDRSEAPTAEHPIGAVWWWNPLAKDPWRPTSDWNELSVAVSRAEAALAHHRWLWKWASGASGRSLELHVVGSRAYESEPFGSHETAEAWNRSGATAPYEDQVILRQNGGAVATVFFNSVDAHAFVKWNRGRLFAEQCPTSSSLEKLKVSAEGQADCPPPP